MTINKFLGLDHNDTDKNGVHWSHSKKYTAMVRTLGYENVRVLLPFTQEELAEAVKNDKMLETSLPRPFNWDKAAGFQCNNFGGVSKCYYIGSALTNLFESHGIYGYTVEDGIYILKQCAYMLIKRKKDKFSATIVANRNARKKKAS